MWIHHIIHHQKHKYTLLTCNELTADCINVVDKGIQKITQPTKQVRYSAEKQKKPKSFTLYDTETFRSGKKGNRDLYNLSAISLT